MRVGLWGGSGGGNGVGHAPLLARLEGVGDTNTTAARKEGARDEG